MELTIMASWIAASAEIWTVFEIIRNCESFSSKTRLARIHGFIGGEWSNCRVRIYHFWYSGLFYQLKIWHCNRDQDKILEGSWNFLDWVVAGHALQDIHRTTGHSEHRSRFWEKKRIGDSQTTITRLYMMGGILRLACFGSQWRGSFRWQVVRYWLRFPFFGE